MKMRASATSTSPLLATALLALAFAACGDPAPDSPDAAYDAAADAGADGASQDVRDAWAADSSPDTAPDAADDAEDDATTPPPPAPVDVADLFVGTGLDGINFGGVFPGAAVPFGMVKLSPDTEGTVPHTQGVTHAGGYLYLDTEAMGFSHIHLSGVGSTDYGNVLVTPQVGDPVALTAKEGAANLPLDHELEDASPGYYRLRVAEPPILCEVTATERTGAHRYTFGGAGGAATGSAVPEGLILVDITHALGDGHVTASDVSVDATTGEVTGSLHNNGQFTNRFDGYDLFFVLRPSRAPTGVGVFDAAGYHPEVTHAEGTRSGVVLRFDTAADPVVELRGAVSWVDLDGARANLDAELPGADFDAVRAAARAQWEDALGRLEVEGGTPTRRAMLYSMLYRAMMMPTLFTDADGRYRGLDKEIHTAEGFTYYSDLSMWDTYRTFHPLMSLLYPERQRDFLRSLERMARDGGTMPQWPLAVGYSGSMIGTSADVVLGDAFLKGFGDILGDLEATYQVMWTMANNPASLGHPGRDQVPEWLAHGYVPDDADNGSVSKTLEYAIDDACLAHVATQAGHPDDAALLSERAGWYEHQWDPATQFFAPRLSDGTFREYSPTVADDAYVEGSAWQYLWLVIHDPQGLVALLGGPDTFTERLTKFVQLGKERFDFALPNAYYWHGNEPDIHAPFLFGYGGRPDLARVWTTWYADHAYELRPGGLAGNDDGGTLGAWYVFAAMGIYPMVCTGDYALSAPLFDRLVLHRDEGDIEIRLGDDPDAAPTWNGAPLPRDFAVAHDVLAPGGTLVLPPAPPGSDPGPPGPDPAE